MLEPLARDVSGRGGGAARLLPPGADTGRHGDDDDRLAAEVPALLGRRVGGLLGSRRPANRTQTGSSRSAAMSLVISQATVPRFRGVFHQGLRLVAVRWRLRGPPPDAGGPGVAGAPSAAATTESVAGADHRLAVGAGVSPCNWRRLGVGLSDFAVREASSLTVAIVVFASAGASLGGRRLALAACSGREDQDGDDEEQDQRDDEAAPAMLGETGPARRRWWPAGRSRPRTSARRPAAASMPIACRILFLLLPARP